MLAKSLDESPQLLTPRQQMEQPFTIGGQKITPTFTPSFAKSGELLFVFLIYNAGATPEGKPDIEVAYTVSRAAEAKPFAKMPNTQFNAHDTAGRVQLARRASGYGRAGRSAGELCAGRLQARESGLPTRRTTRRLRATYLLLWFPSR